MTKKNFAAVKPTVSERTFSVLMTRLLGGSLYRAQVHVDGKKITAYRYTPNHARSAVRDKVIYHLKAKKRKAEPKVKPRRTWITSIYIKNRSIR